MRSNATQNHLEIPEGGLASPGFDQMGMGMGVVAPSNDESLGIDWIASNDVGFADGGGKGERSKRAIGYGHDSINVSMTEVASQSHGVNQVDIGDSFTYELVIDLSGIPVGEKADMVIEIFAMDQNNGEDMRLRRKEQI